MRTLRISVRRLVEFLLRSGDIDSEGDWHAGIEAMQAGSNIHRMLQAAGGDAYQSEVSLAGSIYFQTLNFVMPQPPPRKGRCNDIWYQPVDCPRASAEEDAVTGWLRSSRPSGRRCRNS